MITLDDIQAAARTIGPYIHKTPLIHSNSLSSLSGAEVYLKLENLQKTGSFKVRGAFNKMTRLAADNVIAASMGNHAQAVAYAAQQLGRHARIVMPATVSLVKEEATRGYGADVVLFGESFKEALEHALAQKDRVFIHAFDDEDVIAGQGTIGFEICADLEHIDAVFVPVGGGGLIAGIATAVKALSPRTRVVGVQAEAAPAAFLSHRERQIMERVPLPTIADGIAVGRPGEKTFELMKHHVDEMKLVGEDAISRAILMFLERKKLVVEGAGAVTLAALLEDRERYEKKRVVLVLSGGNIDFTVIDRTIHRGLVASEKIGVFEVTLDDASGKLHAVTGVLASRRANVLDIRHDRLAANLPLGKARVIVTVETRGRRHLEEIFADLAEKGYEVKRRT
ncbi:MAG TPA: threonine ammonia-lyase [Nitrospirota bacterium]